MIFRYRRTGDRHIKRSMPCADAVGAAELGDISLLILCDGASKAAFSAESAERIKERISDLFKVPRAFTQMKNAPATGAELARRCMDKGSEKLFLCLLTEQAEAVCRELTQKYGCRRNELCSTLTAALIERDPRTGVNRALILTIGDGFVSAYDRRHKTATLISEGSHRGNSPNMTYFCTSPDAAKRARIFRTEGFDSLLISSDGITHAVDISDPRELDLFMKDVGDIVDMTDSGFAEGMDLLLGAYVYAGKNEGRNTDDDCSAVYYTTDKRAIKKLAKKYKRYDFRR